MEMSEFPFGVTDWAGVEQTEHPGDVGIACWKTRHFGKFRVRMVEYSADYLADHWCAKGHIILCLEGELVIKHRDNRQFAITPGMSYQVADNDEAHCASSPTGARVFIVD